MSIMETGPQPVEVDGVPTLYGDGMTKQSFKDATDINKILKKAQRAGTLSHLEAHGGEYGDFADVPDLLEAHQRLERGKAIYSELPSELRKEFPDMFQFFEFVNTSPDEAKLRDVLVKLAEPGRQAPAVRRSAATEAAPDLKSAEPASPAPNANGGVSEPPASSTT